MLHAAKKTTTPMYKNVSFFSFPFIIENVLGLYNFPGAKVIFRVTPPAYAMHMDTPPV